MRDTPKRRSPPHSALTRQPIELTTNVANLLLLLVGQLQGLRATGITARRLHLLAVVVHLDLDRVIDQPIAVHIVLKT